MPSSGTREPEDDEEEDRRVENMCSCYQTASRSVCLQLRCCAWTSRGNGSPGSYSPQRTLRRVFAVAARAEKKRLRDRTPCRSRAVRGAAQRAVHAPKVAPARRSVALERLHVQHVAGARRTVLLRVLAGAAGAALLRRPRCCPCCCRHIQPLRRRWTHIMTREVALLASAPAPVVPE